MEKIIILIAIITTIIGCQTVYIPPEKSNDEINNSFVINKPFSEVWNNAINYFLENGIEISILDKSSGLITSESGIKIYSDNLSDISEYTDFGSYKPKAGYSAKYMAQIKLYLVITGDSKTKVVIYAKHIGFATDTMLDVTELKGISNGTLEVNLIKYLMK